MKGSFVAMEMQIASSKMIPVGLERAFKRYLSQSLYALLPRPGAFSIFVFSRRAGNPAVSAMDMVANPSLTERKRMIAGKNWHGCLVWVARSPVS